MKLTSKLPAGFYRSIRSAVGTLLAMTLALIGSVQLPHVFGDELWDNGILPDGVHARAFSPPAFPAIRLVDDFVIEGFNGWTIHSVRASVVEFSTWSSGQELTLFLRADDEGPGEVLREIVTGFERLATGEEYFGMAQYEYLVEGLEVDLCAGTYWFGLRNHEGSGSGTNLWLTSDGGADGPGSDIGWLSGDNGDNWAPEELEYHRSFVLSGTSSTQCGACCLEGGACERLSPRQCVAQHGLARGRGTFCEEEDCPSETRACCLSGDDCIDTSPAECDRLGGAGGSADSDCRDEDDNGRSDACESGCLRDPQWVCDGDVDGDANVNPVDSGLVQSAFGSTDEQDLCNYDIDCDGQINPVDSGLIQAMFGSCLEVPTTCHVGRWLEGEVCNPDRCE